MIRLYVDESLTDGARIKLSKDEEHYYSRVRRGQGEVEVFNRAGQKAKGRVEGAYFVVEAIEESEWMASPLTMAVALPERSLMKGVVFQLSELGLKALKFFPAERSQAAQKRKPSVEKLERYAIEAARQCGRSRPLEINWIEWENLLKDSSESRFFLDEAPVSGRLNIGRLHGPALILVGCEGGWTAAEREQLQKHSFQALHFPTPVLRVETAVVVGAFWGLQKLGGWGEAS